MDLIRTDYRRQQKRKKAPVVAVGQEEAYQERQEVEAPVTWEEEEDQVQAADRTAVPGHLAAHRLAVEPMVSAGSGSGPALLFGGAAAEVVGGRSCCPWAALALVLAQLLIQEQQE